MNQEALLETDLPAIPQSATPTETPPAEVIPLPHVLRQITRDSRDNPAEYLDETRIVAGGE